MPMYLPFGRHINMQGFPEELEYHILLGAPNEQYLRNGLQRPETMSLMHICVCVLLIIINILNVQISVLPLPASWPDFFLKWPYFRVWH